VDNGQIGTFLGSATRAGPVLLDRRLLLPEDWGHAAQRREQANGPEAVLLQTKPQQAAAMLEPAGAHGVPMRWITGDALDGDATHLRDPSRQHPRPSVLALSSTTPVWTKRPAVEPPRQKTGGRPRTQARLANEAPPAATGADVVARWPVPRWQRLVVAEGEQGPRTDDGAACRVIESRKGLPGPTALLRARRSVSEPSEIPSSVSNAPRQTPRLTLAQGAATRDPIEQTIEDAKGETGLDHSAVRTSPRWSRPLTRSIMAHAFLASLRANAANKKRTPGPSEPGSRDRRCGACWPWPCRCPPGRAPYAWLGPAGGEPNASRHGRATIGDMRHRLRPMWSLTTQPELSTVVVLTTQALFSCVVPYLSYSGFPRFLPHLF